MARRFAGLGLPFFELRLRGVGEVSLAIAGGNLVVSSNSTYVALCLMRGKARRITIT
jgi:hypothetical protein